MINNNINNSNSTKPLLDLESLSRDSRRRHHLPVPEEVLLPYLNFQGKESYLAWVSEWKRLYKELTIQIRVEKAELRKPHVQPHAAGLMWQRELSRALARALLSLRHLGKQESARQKRATLAA